jgi:hypothetical protein
MNRASVHRRRHSRVQLRLAVKLSTIDPEIDPATGRPFFRSSDEICANVSRGGALLLTADPVAPGRRVLLEIALPSGDPVEAVGRVAWTRLMMQSGAKPAEAGLGVEFIGGEPDQLTRLERYLASIEPAPAARPSAPARTPTLGGA